MKRLDRPTIIKLEVSLQEASDLHSGLICACENSKAMSKRVRDRLEIASKHDEDAKRYSDLAETMVKILQGF